MKAVVHTETGDPSVLHLVDREPGVPGVGEVRVRVVVSGVNPTDWKTRSGATGPPRDFAELVPNQDGAGIVDEVGDGVTGLTRGQRVWMLLAAFGRPTGTAQEYVVLPAERVMAMPDGVGFDVGASLGVPAVTAHRCLTVAEADPTRLAPGALDGRTVLVAGGAGAVGHAAIQLARWAGATVITTVSGPEKGELARRAGARHVVDYVHSDAATEIATIAPDGVHRVVEVAPAPNAALNAAVLAIGGTVAVYANNGGDQLNLDIRPAMAKNARYQFVLLYTLAAAALSDAIGSVGQAAADGVLAVGEDVGLPLHRFDLEHTADAHAAVESGVTGKVLIDVGRP